MHKIKIKLYQIINIVPETIKLLEKIRVEMYNKVGLVKYFKFWTKLQSNRPRSKSFTDPFISYKEGCAPHSDSWPETTERIK